MSGNKLKVERKFTQAYRSPFTDFRWDERQSEIREPGGKSVFRMDRVVVPEGWSQTACDILAQKYFRKAGVPVHKRRVAEEGVPLWLQRSEPHQDTEFGHECDARQVFGRLAGCWAYWGWKYGYFASEEDCRAFHDELCYMLAAQLAAPNSPSWFNLGIHWAYGIVGEPCGHWHVDDAEPVNEDGSIWIRPATGLYERPAPMACFINSIKDDLVNPLGIMDLWLREARIFKAGGGAGSNYSEVRGKGEPLSGGGKSSGLLGFLKSGDYSAGAIASGGTTRRAARLLALDTDHPDIEEFIDWKPREEDKVAALATGSRLCAWHLEALRQASAAGGWNPDPALNATLASAARKAVSDGVPKKQVAKFLQMLACCGGPEEAESLRFEEYDTDWQGEGYRTVCGQNANNSVRASNRFMQLASAGAGEPDAADWPLYWRTELRKAASEGRDPRPCKVISAAALWRKVGHAAWHCADPGVQFDDTINEWDPCPAGGRTRATNPCFAADTRILTAAGYLRIDDLIARGLDGEFVPVLRHDGSESVPSQLLITGVNPILRVTLSDGRVLRTTPNHTWLASGQERRADELKVGDEVQVAGDEPFRWAGVYGLPAEIIREKGERALPKMPDRWTTELAEVVGHLVGDGCVTAKSFLGLIYGTAESERVELCKRHQAILADLFGIRPSVSEVGSGCRHVRITRKAVGRFFLSLGVRGGDSDGKVVPGTIFTAPPDIVCAFLRGYFGADGSISGRAAAGECEVTATSASLDLLRGVQMLLGALGIQSSITGDGRAGQKVFGGYVRKESFRLRVNPLDLERFASSVGFSVRTKQERLQSQLVRGVKAKRWSVTVVAVEEQPPEPTYNLTEPIDHRVWANGVYIPQCGEYHFKNDTSCNLASLNLLGFYVPRGGPGATWMEAAPGEIDTASYAHAARLWAVALELTVAMSQFPSQEIAANSWKYRTLGLGYANLGALLMSMGLAYDSDEGRAVASGVTALLHFTAGATSAEMAAAVGACRGFLENSEPFLRVVRNHARAFGAIGSGYEGLSVEPPRLDRALVPDGIRQAADEQADRMLRLGREHGYRNCQWTVLAPTGTIALLMSCDTTGVEPDFSLVKWKSLAGGGAMRIASGALYEALLALGYGEDEAERLARLAVGHGSLQDAGCLAALCLNLPRVTLDAAEDACMKVFSVRGAFEEWSLGAEAWRAGLAKLDDRQRKDALRSGCLLDALLTPEEIRELDEHVCGVGHLEGELPEEHLAVFDCASRCGRTGKRSISPEGHVRMLGAVQPFLSGSSSKTINCPPETTPSQILDLYELAWRLMVKCAAVYREGSKLSQPLSSAGGGWSFLDDPEPQTVQAEKAAQTLTEELARGVRRKLPSRRYGVTQKATIGGDTKLYVRTGEYPDGTLGEIFLDMHKEGAAFRAVMNIFAIAVSIGLQYGVPLEEFVDAFVGVKFEPSGLVQGNDTIKMTTSLIDYIFRELAITYLGRGDLASGGAPAEDGLDMDPTATYSEAAKMAPAATAIPAATPRPASPAYTGNACPVCGNFRMRGSSRCATCDDCGFNEGCS